MNLAIEIHNKGLNNYCSLINTEFQVFSGSYITADDLERIMSLNWYLPLKHCDKKSVLKNCTHNQLITALYFYIDINPASEVIMNQWFLDTGCSPQTARDLSSLVYTARIIRLHEEIDINFDEVQSLKVEKYPSLQSTAITVTEILKIMKSGKPVFWSFDSVLEYPAAEYTVIDLSDLRECKIALEDHHNIIIGFSVKYTTFLEIMAVDDVVLLARLSSYVEVGLRDKIAVGSVLIKQPQIIKDITGYRCQNLSFHGINSGGKLTIYNNPDLSSIIFYNKYRLMPLFMKFHKQS